MSDRRFTKIRYTGEEVDLAFEEASGGDKITSTLKSKSAPEPEFISALKALRAPACKILELSDEYSKTVEVRSVTITEKGAVMIHMLRALKLSNTPVILTVPHIPAPEGEATVEPIKKVFKLVDTLSSLAGHYVEGHRAQLELMPNGDGTNGNGRREKQDDIDEEVAQMAREAEVRMRHTLHLNCLAVVLPPIPATPEPHTDSQLAVILLDAWEDVEYLDQQGDPGERKWPGVFLRQPQQDEFLWCGVSVLGAVPALYVDIDPNTDWRQLPATLRGRPLFAAVRELRGLEPDTDPLVTDVLPAFGVVMGVVQENPVAQTDAEILHMLAEHFDEVADMREMDSELRDGEFKYLVGDLERTGYIMGDRMPSLWLRVDPADRLFDRHNMVKNRPTLDGQALVDAVRAYLQIPRPEIETAEQWSHRIRPFGDQGNMTAAAAQAIHTLATEYVDGLAQWHAAALEGLDDEQLGSMIATAIQLKGHGKQRFGWTEMLGLKAGSEVPLEYITIELTLEPPRMKVGKGKKGKTLDLDQMIALARSVLGIEAPVEVSNEQVAAVARLAAIAGIMRVCPTCDREIADDEVVCPRCPDVGTTEEQPFDRLTEDAFAGAND